MPRYMIGFRNDSDGKPISRDITNEERREWYTHYTFMSLNEPAMLAIRAVILRFVHVFFFLHIVAGEQVIPAMCVMAGGWTVIGLAG